MFTPRLGWRAFTHGHLAAAVWLSATDDSLISVLMLFAALACGPVLAIAMAFINWRERRPSSVNLPTHGFPIEPIEHKSDRDSN